MYKLLCILPAISVFICLTICGCSVINERLGQSDDWWGEQLLEGIITVETGISVDLTP